MENSKKLNQKLIKSKFIYFIGAGFSKILGYPIMGEFVDKYLINDLPVRSQLIIEVIKKATGSKDLEIILSSLEKMIDTKYSFKLEEIVNLAEKYMKEATYKIRDPIYLTDKKIDKKSNIINDLNRTVSLIKRKIFETYRPKKRVDYSILDYFFNPLINFNNTHLGKILIPIFTTNYDNVIEDYLKSKKQKITIINGFDKDRIFDKNELTVSKSKNNINVYIFHLHGSIYFYEDKNFNCIRLAEISSFQEDKNYINKIIYPTIDKAPKDEPYFSYYDYLSRCLDNTYYVIFIGYSFRDFESLVRVRSSLIYNKNLKIIIVDNHSDHLKEKIFNNDDRVLSFHCHFDRKEDLKALSDKLSEINL
jgi:hypothetical protein